MTKRTWKYKPGSVVSWCPTCRREGTVTLGQVQFDQELCRCGRPFNRIARMRLKNWMCLRKEPYTFEQAQEQQALEWHTEPTIYRCPFGDHYHLGEASKDEV